MTEDDRIDLLTAFVAVEAKLGGRRVGDAVAAVVAGVPISYRLTWKDGARVTQVDTAIAHADLTMWVQVTRDLTVHSDGEPADVVRELLDTALRDRLAATYPVAIAVDAGRLRVERQHWIESAGAILALATLTADLCSRIDDAVACVEARRGAMGSPYRGR